jgi:hypothetical protein
MSEQTAALLEKKNLTPLASVALQHAAVRSESDHSVQSMTHTGLAPGHDFSQLPAHTTPAADRAEHSTACPVFPRTCPFGGACHTCPARVQPKLKVGQPDDQYEREADYVADQVMRMPEPGVCGDSSDLLREISRTSDRGMGVRPLLTRVAVAKTLDIGSSIDSTVIESSIDQAKSDGRCLPASTRSFMENRFGMDLSNVRVHAGERSDSLATRLGARAFTAGNDIFFRKSEYQPETSIGRELVAHELVHTIQQTSGAIPTNGLVQTPARRITAGRYPPVWASRTPRRIQRAQFTVGSVTINVDYSRLYLIADADLVNAIESRFTTFTGAIDASAIHASLTGLTPRDRRWVLYALDLLQDNTQSPLHNRLNRTEAVQRLVAHAPSAANEFRGPLGPAEEEALRTSGWFEIALAAHLGAPTAVARPAISETLNPPPAGGPGAKFDVRTFRSRMPSAVRHWINAVDPSRWPATGTRDLPTLQTIGDDLMTEARDFFSPYAHTSRTTVLGLNPPFHISTNIFSVTVSAPNPEAPNPERRIGYLRNRAGLVGRNTRNADPYSDANIFRDVNFDSRRDADRVEFERLVRNLAADATVAAAVDRLIRHTGRQSGTGASTEIGLSTEYNAAQSNECEARWEVIDTLCHEIMHALAHPDFEAQTANVNYGQVLLEGFPEVLGTQMFNQRVKPKASGDAAFKGRMEAGLATAPCPAPPDATIGYGPAGSGADSIRRRGSVGDDKFRSAFFLGQVHLVGL